MLLDLYDRPTAVGPGQLGLAQLEAPIYQVAFDECQKQINRLPNLRDTGEISETIYQAADQHFSQLADLFATNLELLGQPRPQIIR